MTKQQTGRDAAVQAAARLIDPQVWQARKENQTTLGSQWDFDERRRDSTAAAERLLAAGWQPPNELSISREQATVIAEWAQRLNAHADTIANLYVEVDALPIRQAAHALAAMAGIPVQDGGPS